MDNIMRNSSELSRILEAEKKIHKLNQNAKPWVKGKTADELISEAKRNAHVRKD